MRALLKCVAALENLTKEDIKSWIEARTKSEDFTALHLASFKGNVDAARSLIEYGADAHALTVHGLNMLHAAAQGDSAASLYYFRKRGVDVNAKDN